VAPAGGLALPDAPQAQRPSDATAWPPGLVPLVERTLVCAFATLTRQGTPVTLPLTPFVGAAGRTLDVSTGLTYPAKAERARRNPRVALLVGGKGSGPAAAPLAYVRGLATVRDGDLQTNTDRYVQRTLAKMPGAYRAVPWPLLRRQRWYWTRIWIEVTPLRILFWPSGRLADPPERWEPATPPWVPPSDPAPPGAQPPPWRPPPAAWQPRAAHAVRHLGQPTLTLVDAEGFPAIYPVLAVGLAPDGFDLVLPSTWAPTTSGPACLSFHRSAYSRWAFHQENSTFVGVATLAEGGARFHVARGLADWSLPAAPHRKLWSLITARMRLAARLRAEAARRGQPLPIVRRPRRA
jgi:hypothetical protein